MPRRQFKYLPIAILALLSGFALFSSGTGAIAALDFTTAYRLVGTAVSEDPALCLAVIENTASGAQARYRIGDRLGDMRIRKIAFGKVTVGADSTEIILSVGGNTYGQAAALDPVNKTDTGRSPSSDKDLAIEEVNATLPDYSHLMQAISVRSQFEAGKPLGFVIYKINSGSIFERMGLKNSDVIVSINGNSLTGTQPVMEFYNAIKTGGTISLEIRREEEHRKLLFEIR